MLVKLEIYGVKIWQFSGNPVVHQLQSMARLFILLKIIVLNSKVTSCVLTNNTFYH